MRILSAIEVIQVFHCIETDEDIWSTYRRYEGGGWENRMGESWESIYDDEELEAAYQKYKVESKQCVDSGGI